MKENSLRINEDFLLLLINKNESVEISALEIKKHFVLESQILNSLCDCSNDNILEILDFLNTRISSKLSKKTFNYCKELDRPYQSVRVDVSSEIKKIKEQRELIFSNQRLAANDNKEFDLDEKIRDLKERIWQDIELWFKAFDIDMAYEEAKKIPNVLVYSHRISGWSKPKYEITSDLKQEVKTNFGYGSVSYFYILLEYKNIQITPLSEWIDYRYSDFMEVIRYTKSFRLKIPRYIQNGKLYFKVKIDNNSWIQALDYTKSAANLSLQNESEFVEKFIISECEKMVDGLMKFYNHTEYDFIDEVDRGGDVKTVRRERVNLDGYELIDFRTEKIIGALDFISKIVEYNSIVPTGEYASRIISLNKKFIPNVYAELNSQKIALKKADNEYNRFMLEHNKLLYKNDFYQRERVKSKDEFNLKYAEEYDEFKKKLIKSEKELLHNNHKVKLYSGNVRKLEGFIVKYNEIIQE